MTELTKVSIGKLQQEMKDFKYLYAKDSEANKEALGELKAGQTHLEEMLTNWMECADNKYASKWAEKAIYGAFIGIATGFLGILIFMIENHFKF
jgi:hypothetical protein